MSTLSYFNKLIDEAVKSIERYDKANKESVAEIADLQKRVDGIATEIEDIKSVLEFDLAEDTVRELEYRLKSRSATLVVAADELKRKESLKKVDDSHRLEYVEQANALRKARDKYKESL